MEFKNINIPNKFNAIKFVYSVTEFKISIEFISISNRIQNIYKFQMIKNIVARFLVNIIS